MQRVHTIRNGTVKMVTYSKVEERWGVSELGPEGGDIVGESRVAESQ